MLGSSVKRPVRRDGRVIIHFDYDCFYAACFEVENPELRDVPLAVQQKQIIVTCNYEARRRGLYKLQLISEAKKACPDVIIILGEDLTRFRDHSKDLYTYFRRHVWSGRAERLGFDEVWLDVTDMVDYNMALVNHNCPQQSWFCLSQEDPLRGFDFDASIVQGHSFPEAIGAISPTPADGELSLRLVLGSHLAHHLRQSLKREKGFTSTVGISTNKELSKLAGNLHKPDAQTTLMPPYAPDPVGKSSVLGFLDAHEVGKIPGIGHKGSSQIRKLVKGHEVGYKDGLVTKFTNEQVTVRDVRTFPGMCPELLEATLAGPGTPKGFGGKAWDLLHGVDNDEVSKASDVPKQISIEDTYLHVREIRIAKQQLLLLSASLLRRMRVDLTENDTFLNDSGGETSNARAPRAAEDMKPTKIAARRWLAHPRTLRLSIRERKNSRSFGRISRSSTMPNFVFNLQESKQALAAKLTDEILLPMFLKLVPNRDNFDVFLINVAATNMQMAAGSKGNSTGRDIGKMFKTQETVLRDWRVVDQSKLGDSTNVDLRPLVYDEYSIDDERQQESPEYPDTSCGLPEHRSDKQLSVGQARLQDTTRIATVPSSTAYGSEDIWTASQSSVRSSQNVGWDSDREMDTWASNDELGEICNVCGATMPSFAVEAHSRYHRGLQ